KLFPGGFLKFVGSNSPSNVKSTTAKYLAAEEPDDCNLNLQGQGDSITMLEERAKRYPAAKMLIGGTRATVALSALAQRMQLTDQSRYMVPCHHCGHAAPLAWENVRWSKSAEQAHPVYGEHQP